MFSNKYAKDVTHALTIQQSNFLLSIKYSREASSQFEVDF